MVEIKILLQKLIIKKFQLKISWNHINRLNIDEDLIRQKIDQGILKEILNDLISKKLLEFEIKDLNIQISDSSLSKNN